MEFHEAADIFPLDESHLDELAADIKANGQRVPIETFGGKIIDGRRRWKACQLAKVQPDFKAVLVDDPVAYVLSLNLHRRHLSKSDLSMVGARAGKLREKYASEAKARQKDATVRGNKTRHGKESPVVELVPQLANTGKSRDQLGEQLGVSGRYIDKAEQVIDKAVPEVVKAVDEGRMSVNRAADLLDQPEEVQKEMAATATKANSREPKEPARVPDPGNNPEDRKSRGKGIELAHKAINCLTQIPKNDALRKRGFQLVADWVKRNLQEMR